MKSSIILKLSSYFCELFLNTSLKLFFMKIGIIKETKSPGDSRCPLIPKQVADLIKSGWDIVVQKSEERSYSNSEFEKAGVPLVNDISACDVLLGVKEVKIEALLENKTYFFFSHTIKEQAYNRGLLKEILKKNIRLIDYEVLANEKGQRLIAFGRFAGMVGAHNGIMAYGNRGKSFHLPRMKDFKNYQQAKELYETIEFPPMKVVLTGNGRVANGAAEVLSDMGFKKISSEEFLNRTVDLPVYCQIGPGEYAKRRDGKSFELQDFYKNPTAYESAFRPWLSQADVFINGIYWDNKAPAFFQLGDLKSKDFSIKTIADITCDIAPVSSVPTTIRPSTIENPIYGFDKFQLRECSPYEKNSVDVMAIDNLPNELPRDASEAFGMQFIEHILPEFKKENSDILTRATIAENGKLGPHFQYLREYAEVN